MKKELLHKLSVKKKTRNRPFWTELSRQSLLPWCNKSIHKSKTAAKSKCYFKHSTSGTELKGFLQFMDAFSQKHAIPQVSLFHFEPLLLCMLFPTAICFFFRCVHQSKRFHQHCMIFTSCQAFKIVGELIRMVRAVWVTVALPLRTKQAAAISAAKLIWSTRTVHCRGHDTVSM